MAIQIDKEKQLFTLQTRNTTYQMKIDRTGVLLHTYYGAKVDQSDLSQLIFHFDRGYAGNPYELGKFCRKYSLDILPQEYSCFGTGDYRTTALRVKNTDGSRACDLRVQRYAIHPGKYSLEGLPAVYADETEAETLVLWLQDPSSHIEVMLQYGVLPDLDVITRAVQITNRSGSMVTLEKAASLSLDWQYKDFDWITFCGRYGMERSLQREHLRQGIQSIGSVRGTSSHQCNPFSILCSPGAGEENGDCYGFSFVYSGEFLMEVECDQIGQTRFVCGIHPDDFAWPLAPGESFQTPEVIMSCSSSGFGLLSQTMHRTIREHLCRGPWKHKRRPVLLNNWEGTYFSFTGDKLVSMAQEAAQIGVELFVMDDGWFGKRDDDNSGLGDWYPNEKKLGCTLAQLGRRINQAGLMFGVWFEPESISEDSDLYRAHPEWAVRIPDRQPNLSRNQLVLDVSRKDVQDYILSRFYDLLDTAPIGYIKWDMNRSICDKYSADLDSGSQGKFSHLYVLGLYRILEALNRRYPNLLIEGCSGGGGRFDAGMLYYTPQIWCSDNTDAVARLDIQYGTSFGYPISSVGAHISAVPNHQTGRSVSLETRACVAMAGTFGLELDLAAASDSDKRAIAGLIQRFKQFYDLIQYGRYYRLSAPDTGCSVWEFVDDAATEALVTAVYTNVLANPPLVCVKVLGLRPELLYQVKLLNAEEWGHPGHAEAGASGQTDALYSSDREFRQTFLLSGSALAHAGLVIPDARKEYQACQFHITACQ